MEASSVNSEGSSAFGGKRARKSAPRKRTSDAWNFFVESTGKDGLYVLSCTLCAHQYTGITDVTSYGTGNLKRHLKKHDLEVKESDEGSYAPLDLEVYREKMCAAIVRHNYPFKIVEHEGMRELLKFLNPGVKNITRNTVKVDVLKMYNKEKEKVKVELEGIKSRVCLTSDIWSSPCGNGYMTVIAHFINEDWVLQKRILNFRHVPPPHNGCFIGDKLISFLKEWGIDRKIFSITLDNASYNDGVVNILKSHLLLKNALVCRGEFIHVRCVAHILNLIVQEGLKVVEVVVNKIRECVKYIRWESRKVAFMELVSQFSPGGGKKISQDVSTRWNSTFLMLETVLQHRETFSQMEVVDSNFKNCPTLEEWMKAEKVAKFLKPFYETTTLFSGCKYPTSNLYFVNMWKIELVIKEQLKSGDLLLSEMAESMMIKFDKYWEKDSVVLSLAICLDPRYKLKMVEYCYSKLGCKDDEVEKLVSGVRDKLYRLFEEYKHVSTYSPQCQSASTISMDVGDERDILDDFDSYQSQHHAPNINKSQLDLYLEEKPLDRKLHADLNILSYWKGNTLRYPELSMMARDILSVPITSVASESAFSIGGQNFGKYRNSLLPSNAEALVCLRDWLNVKYDLDGDGEPLVEDFGNLSFARTTSSNICP